MKYRQLGKTGLMLSEIGLGGEWLERHNRAEVEAVVHACEEQGINVFDCWMAEPEVRSNLGHAIATHIHFENRGFDLVGIFDNSPTVIGTRVGGKTVMSCDSLEEFCLQEKPVVAILCIPAEYAAENADKLVSLGIKGFWNFTQYDLVGRYENVAVENVHLGDSLMTLCYQVKEINDSCEE